MLIDGALSVETPDSSGETVVIDGVDMSSFDTDDGIMLNYEHIQPEDKAKEGKDKRLTNGEELIGKLVYFKKISKLADCESDRQEMYFRKYNEVSYVYGIFRLFDGAGHEGAKALAAIIRDCAANKEPINLRYSVEGSTLDRDKNRLTSTVVRAVAITKKPCNKAASSGLMLDPNAPEGWEKNYTKQDEEDILATLTEKAEVRHPLYMPIGGGHDIEVSPLIPAEHIAKSEDLEGQLRALVKAQALLKVLGGQYDSEHVVAHLQSTAAHHGAEWLKDMASAVRRHPQWALAPIPVGHLDSGSGHITDNVASYRELPSETRPAIVAIPADPHIEAAPGEQRPLDVLDGGHRTQAAIQNGESHVLGYLPASEAYARGIGTALMAKTLTAGGGGGAPSSLTGGAALATESLRGRALAAVRDYKGKKDKGEIRAYLKHELPEVDDSFLDHFTDVASDFHVKRSALKAGLAKSEPAMPSSLVCKLESMTVELRKAAADLKSPEQEPNKVSFAGHQVVPGKATAADGEYELLHENDTHYVARKNGKKDAEDLVRLPKAKENTHYAVHSKPHVHVADLEPMKKAEPLGAGASAKDLADAIEHVNGDEVDLNVDPNQLAYHGTETMDPLAFIDSEGWTDDADGNPTKPGWLKAHPPEHWAEQLRHHHGRQLAHIIEHHRQGKMPPAVQIDGHLGDGRGRAIFHHAIGERMPVAVYRSKK